MSFVGMRFVRAMLLSYHAPAADGISMESAHRWREMALAEFELDFLFALAYHLQYDCTHQHP